MFNERHGWAVILAGGEGRRMRDLIVKWLGYACPKQFCVFVGTRSMLKHTLDRACRLVDPQQILTVIGEGQGRFLSSACGGQVPGWLIEQPTALGTAPAVFLATAVIRNLDPDATLLISPSDHFACPEDGFVRHLGTLLSFAAGNPDRLAVLAAKPGSPETDYGWIQTGEPVPCSHSGRNGFRDVVRFREKPSLSEAIEYFRRGYLWNTMASAVSVKTLWTLGERLLPDITEQLRHLPLFSEVSTSELGCREIRTPSLQCGYTRVAPVDFSSNLLQRSAEKVTAMHLEGVTWSDWGRPKRIMDSLSELGKVPLFAAGHSRFSRRSA